MRGAENELKTWQTIREKRSIEIGGKKVSQNEKKGGMKGQKNDVCHPFSPSYSRTWQIHKSFLEKKEKRKRKKKKK